ncbi:MAG: TfoX/Sxy family protein [Flavobacteriales bacterium]
MAFDQYLVERVQQAFQAKNIPFHVKKMMGGMIFMVDEKMCVGVDVDKKTNEDRLMVRLGKAEYEPALTQKGCREMTFTGKPMKGFVFVYPEGFDTDEDLLFWIEKAVTFNKIAKSLKK